MPSLLPWKRAQEPSPGGQDSPAGRARLQADPPGSRQPLSVWAHLQTLSSTWEAVAQQQGAPLIPGEAPLSPGLSQVINQSC